MDLTILLAALKGAIIARLESIGASFLSQLSVIGMGFLAHEKAIGVKVGQVFHERLEAGIAANKSHIDAIEEAATAAYNEFCHDEVAEFKIEADALITLLKSSALSAAGLKA